MSFRLWMMFYVFALLAAGMATFGPSAGIATIALVLGFWAWSFFGKGAPFTWSSIMLAFLVGISIALLYISLPSAREAALRSQCARNLKEISLGILNYEAANGMLPPAYTVDANGKPMHSWRVLILPYMGPAENLLYRKYNLNEPWNGPNNGKLVGSIPDVYRCPSHAEEKTSSTETNYVLAVGPETAFPGSTRGTIRSIADGTAKTITVIEASGIGVNWMEPRDVAMDEAIQLLTTTPQSGHRHVRDGLLTTTSYKTTERHVARCDGSVHWMGQLSDPNVAKALLTAAGKEVFDEEWAKSYVPPKSTTDIKWGKVWALSLFLLLALLPMRWMWQRRVGQKTAREERVLSDEAGTQQFGLVADAKGSI
jgi:hypothetical protein